MNGPLVTLTSDFGTRDGYVGAMKGRILSLCPEARVVDISHDIPPQDIVAGAWCLRRAVPQFRAGTLHVAVVDPGVGSARPALAIETAHGVLIGPDNGLLSLAAEVADVRRSVAIDTAEGPWARSRTFDGLSLFATAAGHLAAGLALERLGPPAQPQATLPVSVPRQEGDAWIGEVMLHDRFGNAITNIARRMLGHRAAGEVSYDAAGGMRPARLCDHFAALAREPEAVGALWNSDDHLELFVYAGSARERAGIERGAEVRVGLAPP